MSRAAFSFVMLCAALAGMLALCQLGPVTAQDLGECAELETVEEACDHCGPGGESNGEYIGWIDDCSEEFCIVYCQCFGGGSVAAGTCGGPPLDQ